jgi:hypothetical protein
MYQNKLTNRLGDDLYVSARKERGTVFLQIAEGEEDEALMLSLNYDEFIKLRQMLTEAFSEMGW